jgi:hypothetical protein
MAIPTLPTFSAGEILTSSVMNDVSTLGNYQGLFHIKTQTVGSGVSSVTVTGAFSSDFENYLIVDSGGTSSVDGPYRLTFGASAAFYYWALIYASFLGGAVNNSAGNAQASWDFAGGSATRNGLIEVNNPFLATNTEIRSRVRYGTVYGNNVGIHAVSSSFTSFTLTAGAGTMTGGTIRVYGYRKSL